MKVDYLIVGSGFTGATLAERLASLGKKVLLVERRDHIGGNAYDEMDPHGVLVHRYGPHIFHTNSQKVFDYLSRFTEWRPYYHRVRAVVEEGNPPALQPGLPESPLFPEACGQAGGETHRPLRLRGPGAHPEAKGSRRT